ncbi:MAG TPA: 3-phosphoshikimate 1-carboxyvinyltransferase [Gemmatimonadaceae bacterium]|nr:3-phosphoshikimate 1-carboxyvinyltransferase [Gemmatimonadaceae bacterium]
MAPVTLRAPRARLVVQGELRVPGDKSISHRALMLSALAEGRSRIRGILRSADIESTARVLRALGCDIPALEADLVIEGRGLVARRSSPVTRHDLDCGNSGTTARLTMGIAAARPGAHRFTGDESLSRRPMRRVARPLEAMGARMELPEGRDGLPLVLHGGPLHAVDWTLDTASAQIKSAILLAGLCGGVPVAVHEPAPSRDHTERMLRAQGVAVRTEDGRVSLQPVAHLAPLDLTVPGDPSAAAFFAALGALADAGELVLRDVGLNPGRAGFVAVLRRMGAGLAIESRGAPGAEPLGDLVVRPAPLRATTIEGAEVPSLIDELPVLACVAARADGETVIRGAAELRVKESDRIQAVVENLRAVGVEAEELPDGMRIRGTRAALSGHVRTHGDHRLAMAFAVLGATAGAAIHVDDPACVAVSYPAFWEHLDRVAA